jgi:hypothetical protein
MRDVAASLKSNMDPVCRPSRTSQVVLSTDVENVHKSIGKLLLYNHSQR